MSAPAEDRRWWLDEVNEAVPYDTSEAHSFGVSGWRQRDILVDVLIEMGADGADVQDAVRRVLARRAPALGGGV